MYAWQPEAFIAYFGIRKKEELVTNSSFLNR